MKSFIVLGALALVLTGCQTTGGTIACTLLQTQITKFEVGSIAHTAALANYNAFCLGGVN